LTSAGTLWLAGVNYLVGGSYGFQQVLVITAADNITVADLDGEILIEHTRPGPGVTYVGNGQRGHRRSADRPAKPKRPPRWPR
jgi:putative transposase